MSALRRALAPASRAFDADVFVVGGYMAASWLLFEPWFLAGAESAAGDMPPLRAADNAETAPLVGAAFHTAQRISRLR